MANKIKVLQIGTDDWTKSQELPEALDWYFFWPHSTTAIRKVMNMDYIHSFDGILVQDIDTFYDLMKLQKEIEPYTVFYDDSLRIDAPEIIEFQKKIGALAIDTSDIALLLHKFSKGLFRGQYGDKQFPDSMRIHPNFNGNIQYNGFENVQLSGEFGSEFKPVISWSSNFFVHKDSAVELWLEYQKELNCELRLILRYIPEGSVGGAEKVRVLSEAEFGEAVVISEDYTLRVAATLEIRGEGEVKIGSFHQRLSRFEFGKFLLGGRILHDENRNEINCYFHPGDFKPPLSVYFSGYRPAEGFEGFFMMKRMGTPFILFSDPRLEGGSFYLGSKELEQGVISFIQEKLDFLGFTNKDLILSGMSMGTFPSMFYGADFEPCAIIVAKLLTNIGTIANRGRLLAPNTFPTSYDMLKQHTGGTSIKDMENLDNRFWSKFKKADFSDTTFGISYMKDEDYDPTAYEQFREALYFSGAHIMSKGTAGRHNDDTNTAANWFLNFYKMILQSEFGRE